MNPTRLFTFTRRVKRLALVLLATALSWTARGQGVTIDLVLQDPISTPPANGVAYNVGEEIFVVAVFSASITSVTGVPKLRLTPKRAGQLNTYAYATYYDHFDNAMFFKYVVESGDFTQDLNADRFERVGTVIQTVAGLVGYDTQSSFPATGAASLEQNAAIAIRTIGFRGQSNPLAMSLSVQESESGIIPVTRGNIGGKAVNFTISAVPAAAIGQNFTLSPAPFAIPINTIDADLTLTGVLSQPGTVLQLHPTDYGSESGGDLLVTVDVTSGPTPTFFIDGVTYGLIEGDAAVATAYITLSRPPTAPLTITLANNNPSGLSIVGPPAVTFPIGATIRPYQVRALDGGTTVAFDSTATISGTASAGSGYISAGSAVFSLLNRDPVLLSPQGTVDNPWVPTPGGEGFPYTFSWSGTDVPADISKLQAQVAFGDGNVTPWTDGANGFVNHTYNTPGTYTVTVTLRDQDGGYASVSGQLEILPAIQVQINEYKYSSPPYIGPGNSYRGLGGLGRGTVDDLDALTVRVALQGDYNWLIKYAPTVPSVSLVATPEIVTIDGINLDSFFHVWIGDGFIGDMLTPIAPSTALLQLGGENRQVGGVFSREYYPDDNYADIDHDELPDLWEWLWGSSFELPNRMDNPDGDLLPRGAGAAFAYPAAGDNYTPDGGAFGHVFEVRGLNAGLNAPDSIPSPIVDEPGAPLMTAGWTGTNPTVPDTDGDTLNDGYEYYFWMNATVRGIVGQRYDPARVIEGTVIPSATIATDFNPLVQGAEKDDTDGDGLSNREEYVLGTNPVHWDTDGDGMNDAWEVAYGLDPFDDGDADGNPDGDWMARSGALRHWQVYLADGYDPRVAWGRNYLWRNRSRSRRTPTTDGFTNYEEHYLGRLCIEEGIVGAVAPVGSGLMTSPIAADSDADQMPDGWELYVSRDPVAGTVVIWPISSDNYIQNSALDADYDGETDADELTVRQEFHASETCAVYGFANVNDRWWNKFWATDPWNPDTDGDALADGSIDIFGGENWTGFQYDSGYTEYIRGSRPGGMLNPCCVDTDMDYLPDAFEYLFPGNISGGEIVDGMDGTYFDSKSGPDAITGAARNFDFDGDGLENYQEYWMNTVFHFQYDKWVAGQGYGAYDPALIFSQFPYGWDWAANADYSEMIFVPFAFMPVEFRPASPYGPVCYASTDPRLGDTDEDGMDDFYEMFHGLNPLLSQIQDLVGKPTVRPPDVYDFRTNPWLAGVQNADPDQDGIPNYEEMLMPNRPEPANHHTDPSPLWFTDTSYANSFVNLYYNMGAVPMYWVTNSITSDPFPEPSYMETLRPYFMFSFEIGEGFDTDNDNLQDKHEILDTTEPGVTDPLDTDAPRKRKALYLDGGSAARTRIGFAYGPDALRSWTIEVWVRPVTPAAGVRQIILERPVQVFENDPMPAPDYVRRTFRLGLEWNGAPFVEYDNSGKVALTERALAADMPLPAATWTHLAATMSGVDKKLTLYINGKIAASVATASIPCTGFIDGSTFLYSGAPVIIGASDANPQGAVNGAFAYINGGFNDGPSQPVLGDYFKGWVDEIRIWDGARSHAALAADLTARKRYTRDDVIVQREAAVAELQRLLRQRGYVLPPAGYSFDGFFVDAAFWLMRTGGETPDSRLPPTLLSHYSFDNLPDPQHEPIVPAGFDRLNGRPTVDYPGVPWWMQAADRSTVYRTFDANPYLFVHWIENTVATLPIGHLDSAGLFVDDSALDSRYWTRFSTGGAGISNGFENVFNNTSNPYGLTYKHGDSTMNQVDTEDFEPRFDPMSDSQYNHLLPLRGAVADLDVPLWDNGTPGTTDADSDGDGLPDAWELAYGLDPYDPADAIQDSDEDGLSNLAEFRAGTNPWATDSDDDGIDDFEDTSPGSSQMNGFRFTDNDFVEDEWEDGFVESYASPFRFDEHLDLDGDGWDNWSERRFGASTRPDQEYSPVDSNGVRRIEFPTPDLQVTLDYQGVRDLHLVAPNPVLVVHAYTDPYMNGMPDAVYMVPLTIPDVWPMTFTLTVANLRTGHLRQGLNYLHAFIDLDNSQSQVIDPSVVWFTWTPGEPAAVADGNDKGVAIGWDRNEVRFGLTDEAKSFMRLSWTDLVGESDTPHKIALYPAAGGSVVFERTFAKPRTWLHEGDIMAGKTSGFGLTTTGTGTKVYRWTLDDVDAGLVTNIYPATLAAPTAIYPKGDSLVYRARPEFHFRLAPEATEFEFTLKWTLAGVDYTVFSGRYLAPPRRALYGYTDVVVWSAPYCIGDVTDALFNWISSISPYTYTVKAYSPAHTAGSAASAPAAFVAAVSTTPNSSGGKGWFTVNVRYPGGVGLVNGAKIRAQAFTSRSFNGLPAAEKQLGAAGAVTFAGLEPGTYFVRAFVDQNGNRKRDAWESSGYLRDELDPLEPFRVVGIEASNQGLTPAATLTIRDANTDNDLLPDALEYAGGVVFSPSLAEDPAAILALYDGTGGMGAEELLEAIVRANTAGASASAWDAGYSDIGGGWRRLAWFGDYVPMGVDGWFWHSQHGFIFVPAGARPESLWFFTEDMGWLWTGNTTYPFLFRNRDGAWIWYNGTSSPRWFRNMATGGWESRP